MTSIGEITLNVCDITDRKSVSLVQEAGEVRVDDGRVISIRLASRRIEYWIKHEGHARYFSVDLNELSEAAVTSILTHLDAEGQS